VLEFGNWEEQTTLVEFTYNNSHQAILGMAPYEAFMVGGAGLLYVEKKKFRIGSCMA
jgi:hypothetical protein